MSRDPIGYAGSEWNLYEYVSGNPVMHLDPTGRFRIIFAEGFGDSPIKDLTRWNAELRNKVTQSVARLLPRVDSLINDAEQELASLSPCMRKELSPEIDAFLKMLRQVRQGLLSERKTLFLYHTPEWFPTKDRKGYQIKDTIVLVDAPPIGDGKSRNDWQSFTDDALDGLLLHEISHIYGTEDDATAGVLMNAHDLENFKPMTGRPTFEDLKRNARKKCPCD